MKPQYFLPIATAAIGFAVAWIAKPAPVPQTAKPDAVETSQSNKNLRAESRRTRPDSISERRPTEVKAGDFPLVAQAEQGPKTRTEGKMLRLTEALGLSIDQQGEIIKAIEDNKPDSNSTLPLIQDLTGRGQKVEDALAKTLTKEQFAKFQELQVRERDNRIESRSQGALTKVIEEIDLSPGQRDEVLARLRLAEKERIQAIPAAATLLLNTSVLPTSPKDLSVDGVLTLSQIAEPSSDNPESAYQHLQQTKKRRVEEKLRCFDGIFSPGQMAQYHAILAEEKAILDRVPPAAVPPPGSPPPNTAQPDTAPPDTPPSDMPSP